jgi:hypothetical protein
VTSSSGETPEPTGGQAPVDGGRGPLVHRAPEHVHGDEVGAHDVGQQRLLDRAHPVAPAQFHALGLDLVEGHGDPVQGQDVGEASPCQNFSWFQMVMKVLASGSLWEGLTSMSRR